MASSDSAALLLVLVDTSLDTHLATAASPHDTLASLKSKLAAQHLVSFPAFGSIRIRALVTHKEGTAYRLADSLSLAAISDATKEACFLEALVACEVKVPNTDEQCGIPLKQKTKANKGKSKRVERTDIENGGRGKNFDEKRARKKAKVPGSDPSVSVHEPEGENLRHDSDSPEIPVEREVLDPSSACADSTSTPLKPVDEENRKRRAGVDSTLVVRPEGSMCSKCASVFEKLKKVKRRKNFYKDKLSVKVGTITELRKMLEAENRATGLTSQFFSLQPALSLSEDRARQADARLAETAARLQKTEASLEEMERKWTESDMKAKKAEAKCAEVDAMAHNAKEQMFEIDVRAQKSEVKACKFEVKLKEAEVWAQKANAELAKAEKRAHKLEEKLMEALERARSAEAKVTEIDARLKESQRKALDLKAEGGEATLMQAVALGRIKKEC